MRPVSQYPVRWQGWRRVRGWEWRQYQEPPPGVQGRHSVPHWHSLVFSPEHWDPAAALPVTEMIQIMQIADGGNTHHSPSSGMAVHSALNPGN